MAAKTGRLYLRASESFMFQQGKRSGVAVAIVAIVLGAVYGFLTYRGPSKEDLSRAVEQGTIMKELGVEKMSPYEFIKRGVAASGGGFGRSFGKGLSSGILQNAPGSDLQFDEVAVMDDLGSVMRGSIKYRGQLADEKGKMDAPLGK